MFKRVALIMVMFSVFGVNLTAKSVSHHEALVALNKVVGLLVNDKEKLELQLKEMSNKVEQLEKKVVTFNEANQSKISSKSDIEIELDRKILEYVSGK